jgi:hypothetical protein
MKYLLLLFLVAGALGGYYYYQHGELPFAVAPPAPTSEPTPPPIPSPTPVLAKTTPPPVTPAPRQLTPDGVFVVVKPASVETPDGILGIKPGDTVKVTGEAGVYLFNGSIKVALRADQVTNDVATARAAITRDRSAQAALAQGGLMILSSLDETLSAAAQQQKLTFVLMGRSTCGNCNATREGIRDGKIMVTGARFIMADIDADNSTVSGEFAQKFGEGFGNTLPFVAITDSSGKLLASSGGYKSPEQWNALLSDALKRAAPAKAGR